MPFGRQPFQYLCYLLHLASRVEKVGAEADAVRAVNRPGHDAKTLLEGGNQLWRRPVVKADGNETTGGFWRCWAEKIATTNEGYPLSEKIGKAHGDILIDLGLQKRRPGSPHKNSKPSS